MKTDRGKKVSPTKSDKIAAFYKQVDKQIAVNIPQNLYFTSDQLKIHTERYAKPHDGSDQSHYRGIPIIRQEYGK